MSQDILESVEKNDLTFEKRNNLWERYTGISYSLILRSDKTATEYFPGVSLFQSFSHSYES